MEKLTPSYKLSDVKRHIAAGRVHATFSSIKSAALLAMPTTESGKMYIDLILLLVIFI
jgi:hypothetical protein